MSQVILLVLAVYVFMVGYHGHASQLFSQLAKDLPGFVPWLIAVTLLGLLAVNHETGKLVKPFIALIVVAIVIKEWAKISSTGKAFYAEFKK